MTRDQQTSAAGNPAAVSSGEAVWPLIVLSFLVMTIFGLVENIKGPVVPAVLAEFGVSYSTLGVALSLAYPGYLLACFVGGLAAARYGIKAVLGSGFILIGAGSLLMALAPSVWTFSVFLFVINFGFGCFEVGANSLGARIFVRNAAVLMNLMHLFYGAGSVAGPVLAAAAIAGGAGWRQAYLWSIAFTLVVFIYLLLVRFPAQSGADRSEQARLLTVLRDHRVWLFISALGFAEVIELGIGNWLVNFLQEVHGFPEARAAGMLSLFFVLFSAGRILGGFFAERVGYTASLIYAAGLYFLFFLAGLVSGPGGAVFFSLTGLPVSIMFPTMMAVIMRTYREGVSAVMGVVITCSGVVNMIFKDLIVGRLNDLVGVYAGFSSFLLWCGLVILFVLLLQRRLGSAANEKPIG